jgi:hypothetical protein
VTIAQWLLILLTILISSYIIMEEYFPNGSDRKGWKFNVIWVCMQISGFGFIGLVWINIFKAIG